MFISFLEKLAQNNNREWLEANRKAYEDSKKEVEEIVEKCIAEIGRFQDLGTASAKNCMFRIYRDVRFSKNKDPYKLNFSALIGQNGKKSKSVFGWYIHFQPNGSFLAAGLYEPLKEQLAKIRQEIDYNGEHLSTILQSKEFKETFGEMKGNQLKTIPKGYQKNHQMADLLRFNQYYVIHPFQNQEVISTNFPQKVAEICKKANPFLSFFEQALA